MAARNKAAGFWEEHWGGQRNYSSGFHNDNRAGYGNSQSRWISNNNVGRGGGHQNRFRGHGEGTARTNIDADLLHQTVQAVVAAVTAVHNNPQVQQQSATPVPSENVPLVAPSQPVVVMVAAQPDIPQQEHKGTVEAQVAGGNAKENEEPGPLKKKKDDKTGCFRCKKPGHFIDDCTTPYCDLCESIHHVSSACHLLQAPKPTAIAMWCFQGQG
jgi:hypothetical protein